MATTSKSLAGWAAVIVRAAFSILIILPLWITFGLIVWVSFTVVAGAVWLVKFVFQLSTETGGTLEPIDLLGMWTRGAKRLGSFIWSGSISVSNNTWLGPRWQSWQDALLDVAKVVVVSVIFWGKGWFMIAYAGLVPSPLDLFGRPTTEGPTSVEISVAPAVGSTGQRCARRDANLRAGPGANYDLVGNVAKGVCFEQFSKTSDPSWIQVTMPDGSIAFIAESLVPVSP